MKKEIKISKENVLNAYKNASAEGKELLEHLLGKELFDPKDIMERVKTFDDARKELNSRAEDGDAVAAVLLADYESNADNIIMKETLAYMKLCIITAALNEGWEPQFTECEYRYFPFYWLYTKEEIDSMSNERRARLLFVGGSANDGSICGLSASSASFGFSISSAHLGARLAFKTRELAEYAGKQFVDIYSVFMFRAKDK